MVKKMCQICMVLALFYTQRVSACTPIDLPNLLSQTITGNSLLLNWESTTLFTCPGYSVQVEIICASAQFTGSGPFYYSPELNKITVAPQAYAQQSVGLSGFCPGQVYMFRAREVNTTVFGNWTSVFTFTVPGIPNQPALSLSASINTVCPGMPTQLNSYSATCAQGTYTYSWFPAAGLSCTNCPNPVASPIAGTTYTCYLQGDPSICWSASSTIAISINTASSSGTVAATPSVCAGGNATVGLTGGGPLNTWQLSTNAGVTWSATGFSNTTAFSTGTLAANQCFRAVVSGCGSSYISAPQCITVQALPQLTITSSGSLICEGDVAILTVSGAQNYLWAGASQLNTPQVAASPIVTTTYNVSGTDANGCTNTASFVLEVAICTSVQNYSKESNELTILPNPNSGYFSITGKVPGKYTITNELGQVLCTVTLNESNNNSASVQQLPHGIYFIISSTGSGTCKKISITD